MFRLSKATLIIPMLSLVAALSLAACGGETAAPATPTPNNSSTNMSNADLLKAAVANMKNATSYHLDMNANQAGQAVTLSGDFILPDKSKLNMQAAGQTIDLVKVGSDTYVSTDGGKTYTKMPADQGNVVDLNSITNMWSNFKPDQIDQVKDQIKDGNPATDTIDGVTTKHMQGDAKSLSSLASASSSSNAQTPTAVEGTVEIWVSTDANPTVRQMRVSGTSGGSSVDGTLKWSKINDSSITIEAPTTTP